MFNDDGVKTADSVNEAKGLDFFGNPKDDDNDNAPSHAEIIANAAAKNTTPVADLPDKYSDVSKEDSFSESLFD